MRLSLKCKLYGDMPHGPCSGTTDDGLDLPCECWCHGRRSFARGLLFGLPVSLVLWAVVLVPLILWGPL